jgi:hypothetical protein
MVVRKRRATCKCETDESRKRGDVRLDEHKCP